MQCMPRLCQVPWCHRSPPWLAHRHLHHHPCTLALPVPNVSRKRSVLQPMVPRCKLYCPPFTAPSLSRTDSTLDLLHCRRPSWRTQHLHIHKPRDMLHNTLNATQLNTTPLVSHTHSTQHNLTQHLRLATSIIKHIWNMTRPVKPQTSHTCVNHSSHTHGHTSPPCVHNPKHKKLSTRRGKFL
jgi:hypothetical protein